MHRSLRHYRQFSPLHIPDLTLWLTRIKGLTQDQGVTNWEGRSRRRHTATQTTADNKPLYKQELFNRKPGVKFDGTNDWMSIANHNDFLIDSNTNMTWILVIDDFNTTTDNFWLVKVNPGRNNLGQAGAIGYDLVHGLSNTIIWRVRNATFPTATISTIPSPPFIISCRFDRSSVTGLQTYVNGATQGIGNAVGVGDLSAATQDLSIMSLAGGAGLFANTEVAEILFFRTALRPNFHNRIGRYFQRIYNTDPWTQVVTGS